MTKARRDIILGRQFHKCNNDPHGPSLYNLEGYKCPMWMRDESPGSFDASGGIIDHIDPWAQTRDDSDGNLQALCPACSAAKTKSDNDDTRDRRAVERKEKKGEGRGLPELKQVVEELEKRREDLLQLLERKTMEADKIMMEAKRAAERLLEDAKRNAEMPIIEVKMMIDSVRAQIGTATEELKRASEAKVSSPSKQKKVLIVDDEKAQLTVGEKLLTTKSKHLRWIISRLVTHNWPLDSEFSASITKLLDELPFHSELCKLIMRLYSALSLDIRDALGHYGYMELKPLCSTFNLRTGTSLVSLLEKLIPFLEERRMDPLLVMIMVHELKYPETPSEAQYSELSALSTDRLKKVCSLLKVTQSDIRYELVSRLHFATGGLTQQSVLGSCTVSQLRILCKSCKVSDSGTKAELISNLIALKLTPLSLMLMKLEV